MDILRTATDLIFSRPSNFTYYWDHTSPLFLLDPYYNEARQSNYDQDENFELVNSLENTVTKLLS